MARVYEIIYALDTVRNIEGLRGNIRKNAIGYKQSIAEGRDSTDVVELIKKDVAQYDKRLGWQYDIMADSERLATLETGVKALGVSSTQYIEDDCAEIEAAVRALAKVTTSTIVSVSDKALELLPAHPSVWPNA